MASKRLDLKKAIKTGRLPAFIAQEEARGVGSTTLEEFNNTLRTLLTQPQSEDQTSRSASRDGSSES